MNAEALVGKVLANYTLQQVIGQGSMGAVYLAQQPRRHRKFAVKVFIRASALEPLQYMDFLVRLRHELNAVVSLDHPHILPVHEYGERDGFVYLVMPYVVGGNLQDVLKSHGMLPFPKIVNYLDQLAAALDYAHQRGIIHRDIKPSNILVTANSRVLLTDFALSKAMTEGIVAQIRQFTTGTLDYMAPELVMGKEVDERADLYSLGAILYHMVTGIAPFQGDSLVEVAKRHLQVPPLPPGSKRVELPIAAEQVISQALAKRPADRYVHAQDLAAAFRLALTVTNAQSEHAPKDAFLSSGMSRIELYTPHGLFDPKWRTGTMPTVTSEQAANLSSRTLFKTAAASAPSTDPIASFDRHTSGPVPEQASNEEKPSLPIPAVNPVTPAQNTPMFPVPGPIQGNAGTFMQLTGPAKVVSMSVPGQPGRYITGLLPITQQEAKKSTAGANAKGRLQKHLKVIGLVMVALLILGTTTFWFAHTRSNSMTKTFTNVVATPDLQATATARVVATANANIILFDPLSQNIHNWPIATSGSMLYEFKDGAYHITDNDATREAPALLPALTLTGSFVYTLTLEEIKGDDTSVNNEFGMIIRSNIQHKNGKQITTFYSFEVMNKPGGEYQFWKYDDSQGTAASPWTELGHQAFGGEFHEGQGPKSINAFKIIANGKNFTLIVNGEQVWAVQDSSFASGGVGMLVNLEGTEVAFSNLKLTYS